MKRSKLEQMFELARELYAEEQKERGMVTPIPYCFAHNKETGELLVFSAFGVPAVEILQRLRTMGFPFEGVEDGNDN